MDQPDPNRVIKYPEHGISVTPYEQVVDALASAVLAAGYPSDALRRAKAVRSCQLVNLDYIEAVARMVEHTGATPEQARWRIVEYLGNQVGNLQAIGATAREGIGSSGYDTDPWGVEMTPDYEPRED